MNNPTPAKDCPSNFTVLKSEVWRRYEAEGLSDPVFAAETERILADSSVNAAPGLLNEHLSNSKAEKKPEFAVFKAPISRDG